MSLFQRINNLLPETKGTQNTAGLTTNQLPATTYFNESKWIGNEMTLYAAKDGESFINYGYNINSVVHTCINIIQKMFGKIPFYVAEIKKDEKKAWQEGMVLSKMIHDQRAQAEWRRIKKKSIDGIIIDNDLAAFINKPNRNQTGVDYREDLIGKKKLTGEGNQWFVRGIDKGIQLTEGRPLEMFVIPKFTLQLIGNQVNPWEIVAYQLTLGGGQTMRIPKENILMWIERNHNFAALTLDHLRGQPPLEAALLNIQALNESAVRQIKESVNGGANGLLFRKDAKEQPKDPATISWIRSQINSAVNGQDVADAIAWLAGEWGYLPFGHSSRELQRMELNEKNQDMVCNVLGVPPGLLKSNQTYENAPTYWKQLVYGTIAPEAYSLRDAWNNSLVEMFGFDPERVAIDCDVMSIPELSEDLKAQVAAVKDANWLSKNEKRIATGYEPLGPEYDVVPVDGTGEIGGPLDQEVQDLNA